MSDALERLAMRALDFALSVELTLRDFLRR